MGQHNSRQEDFFEACSFGREWKVQTYIDEGIDVNWKSHIYDSCPIHVASQGKPKVVQMLIKANCDVNAKDEQGNTALHHASMAGDEETAKILIAAGASVNSFNNQHWTPLINAAYWNQPNLIKLLLTKNANITWRNKEGRNALHELCRSKSTEEESLLKSLELFCMEINRLETIDRFRRDGINLDAKWSVHSDGYNPRGIDVLSTTPDGEKDQELYPARNTSNNSEPKSLLDLKSEVESISWESEADFTPLMFACYHGHYKLVSSLLNKKVNIHLTDENGWSALHWAAQRNHVEIVRLLIDNGANIYLSDIRDEIPYDVTSNDEIKKLLCPEVEFPKIISNGYVTTDDESLSSDYEESKENSSQRNTNKHMKRKSSNQATSRSSSIQSTYNALIKQFRLPAAS